jgi:ribosomal protein S18 acetylase RimI-like enzyme
MSARATLVADATLTPDDFASVDDLAALRAYFDGAFDPLAERIPNDEELRGYLKRQEILLNRSPTGAIRGFMIRSQIGKTHHLKYLFVSSDNRGQRIGELLFAQFRCAAKAGERLILWVFHDNKPAIKLYQKHGFKADGVTNLIFVSP